MTHVSDEDDQGEDDKTDMDADGRFPRPLAQMAAPGEEKKASGDHDDQSDQTNQDGGQLLPCIEAALRGHLPAQEGTSANGLAKPEPVVGIPVCDFMNVFDESLSCEEQEENQRDPNP